MKNIFQHGATLWDFCVILMRNDCICLPAELADFRRKNICGYVRYAEILFTQSEQFPIPKHTEKVAHVYDFDTVFGLASHRVQRNYNKSEAIVIFPESP